jgi:hypothetical protein
MLDTVSIVMLLPAVSTQKTARNSFDQLELGKETNDTALLGMSNALTFNTCSLYLAIARERIDKDVHGLYGKYSSSKCLLTNHTNLSPSS